MTKPKRPPTAHERYAEQVRAEGRTCSPYRLGLAVGAGGDNLPSPYQPGTRGDHNYFEGLEHGRIERKINAKACELYHASCANDPTHAWHELSGQQKWSWREKAIEALAGPADGGKQG